MGSAVGCIGSALGSAVGCIAAFLSAIRRSISGKGINELKSIRRGFCFSCNLSTICSLFCDKGLGLLEDLLRDLDDLDLLDVSFIV
jgi:hypothetical protein